MLFRHKNIKINVLYIRNMMNKDRKEIKELTGKEKWNSKEKNGGEKNKT